MSIFELIDKYLLKADCPGEDHEHRGIKGCHSPNVVHKDPRVRHHNVGQQSQQKPEQLMGRLNAALARNIPPKTRLFLTDLIAFNKRFGYLTDKQWDMAEEVLKKLNIPDRENVNPQEAAKILAEARQAAFRAANRRRLSTPGASIAQRAKSIYVNAAKLLLSDVGNKFLNDAEKNILRDIINKVALSINPWERLSPKQLKVLENLVKKYADKLNFAPMAQNNLSSPVASPPTRQSHVPMNYVAYAIHSVEQMRELEAQYDAYWKAENVADVKSISQVGEASGVNSRVTKAVTFADGSKAVYKTNNIEHQRAAKNAYNLANFLGFTTFPITHIKDLGAGKGSVMAWIDGFNGNDKEAEIKRDFPTSDKMQKDWLQIVTMDALTGNWDRHGGNYRLGTDGHLYAIDNDYSFDAFGVFNEVPLDYRENKHDKLNKIHPKHYREMIDLLSDKKDELVGLVVAGRMGAAPRDGVSAYIDGIISKMKEYEQQNVSRMV